MKKVIFLLLLSFAATGCHEIRDVKYEKPFLIIDKEPWAREDCSYTAQDKNGELLWFTDKQDIYRVGDTIK